MQPEAINNTKIKKSSVQLSENQDEVPEPQPPKAEQSKSSAKQQKILDLLDLENQEQEFSLTNYRDFLQDRVVIIEGPELITENMIKSYKLYKIKSRKKNQEKYDTCVSRRFSDFQYLQERLINSYGGCIIPLLPEKNFWTNVNWEGEEFAQQRVKGLQKYLKSLLFHEKLKLTGQVRNFLFFDEVKFSEGKGDFFSKIKTEDRVKTLASNAFNFGLGIYSKYFQGKKQSEEFLPKISKPTLEDLKLMEYQRDIDGLMKVTKVLQQMVYNSVEEMRIITNLEEKHRKQSAPKVDHQKIKVYFQEVSQYIKSCHDALERRNFVRMEMESLNEQLEHNQKKAKTNPRSQEIDIIRNRLAKATEKCEKWTNELLGELERSVVVGKSMVEEFIKSYTHQKQKFYNS